MMFHEIRDILQERINALNKDFVKHSRKPESPERQIALATINGRIAEAQKTLDTIERIYERDE